MAVIHPDAALSPAADGSIWPGMTWPPEDPGADTGPPYGMVFTVEVTDLQGNVLTWVDATGTTQSQVRQFTGLAVQLQISDDRTASLTLSLYHPAVANLIYVSGAQRIAALARMVRIRYRGTTIFWGLVVTPKFSVANATVELQLQGPAFKLRNRQLNYSDPIVSPEGAPESAPSVQNPADWTTIKQIVEAAYDTEEQYDAGVPDIGVRVFNVSGVSAPASAWVDLQRGSENWERLIYVTESLYGGGEFDVVPYDPGPSELPFDMSGGTERPYRYADLKVYDQLGQNRTGDDLDENPDDPGSFDDPYSASVHQITFLYDDQDPENSNLTGFDWEPDGTQVHNQRVALVAASSENKRGMRAIARNLQSWKEIGVYSAWESPGGQNEQDVSADNLKGLATIDVERQARPPNFCKLTLHLEPADEYSVFGEVGWKPQPLRDFYLGDRVKVRARKGYMDTGLLVMRIMAIKISQADADDNVTVELDVVPHMSDLAEITADVTGP